MTRTPPSVELRLPSVLQMVVGRDRIAARGHTIPEALRSVFAELPQLEAHLTLPSGEVRPHILCVVNGDVIPRQEVVDHRLGEGDEILIHQAISGG